MAHDHHHHVHENGADHDHKDHHHGVRETVEHEWGNVELESHTHDQASTVSMNVHLNEGCEISFSNLVAIMQTIAQVSEEAGGIVGHIKAFVQQGGESACASVTAADLAPTVTGSLSFPLGVGAKIELVAIVLLIDQADLLAICRDALASFGIAHLGKANRG